MPSKKTAIITAGLGSSKLSGTTSDQSSFYDLADKLYLTDILMLYEINQGIHKQENIRISYMLCLCH